ncbi:hypothetical protein ACP275_09G062100 [Erythranthe tilingii]
MPMLCRKKRAGKMIVARSFSPMEQKKLGCAAFFLAFFIIAVTLSSIFKPYLGPLPTYFGVENTMKNPIISNLSNSVSDVYEIEGDVRIHGSTSTIFISTPPQQINSTTTKQFWSTKPYPRKEDTVAMAKVTTFKIQYATAVSSPPQCDQIFTSPAVVFSAGGYAGNHYHAFVDVLVPLFSTSHHFNRDVVFLVTNDLSGYNSSSWTSKYKLILDKLSKHDIYKADTENRVLCFSRIVVGLIKTPREFAVVDPHYSTNNNSSTRDFNKLVRSAYSLKRESLSENIRIFRQPRPRMLIIRRRRDRHLSNGKETVEMARSLGFDVVMKPVVWNVSSVARFVNSFDVLVGVHGAGLTNMVFLPENAVVIQIVPFGLENLARSCFGKPAEGMNFRYLEYKGSLNESSLVGKYSDGAKVYADPAAIYRKGFDGFRSVYLDNQDINLDLGRFKGTLLRALELLRV